MFKYIYQQKFKPSKLNTHVVYQWVAFNDSVLCMMADTSIFHADQGVLAIAKLFLRYVTCIQTIKLYVKNQTGHVTKTFMRTFDITDVQNHCLVSVFEKFYFWNV